MALKIIIIPVLLILFGIVSLLACLGEKAFNNKVLYAALTCVSFILLLVSAGI